MMNKIEEAIVYATVMHQGKVRKQRKPSEADNLLVCRCVERIAELTEKLDTLAF